MQTLFDTDFLLQVRGMTPGRAAAMLPMAMGLISLVTGWLALARSASRARYRQIGALVALALGLTGVVLAGLHLARTSASIGTGSGKLGAIVATLLAVIGIALSALTLSRLRRA